MKSLMRSLSVLFAASLIANLSVAVAQASPNTRSNESQRQGGAESGSRQPQANAGYAIPDRVEVNYSGVWYPGNVYAVRDGRYKVMRDDYTSDDRWVTAADLRPLAYDKRPPVRPAANQPRSIAAGKYACYTITGGFAGGTPSGAVLGSMRIGGPTTYNGLAREGTGPQSTYDYDASSGLITWNRGKIEGFFGILAESRYAVDSRGIPTIHVVYRVRPGGNLFDLSCRRE